MRNFRQATMLAGAAMLLLAPMAFAQATDAEFKCEASASKAAAKFVGSKSKCIQKCSANAWKNIGTFSDCFPPYGGTTLTCIDDSAGLNLKGAEQKFRDAIRKACDPTFKVGTDCPECYASGDCSTSGYATNQVQNIEGQVDSFVPGVLCETTGATTAEQKCQTSTAKALVKQVGGVDKAYDKCFANARKNLIPVSSCAPPASDPATAAAIAKVDTKAILAVDKACGPECLGGNQTCGSNTGTCSSDSLVQCGCDADCGDQSAAADCNAPDDDSYPTGSAWVNLVDIAISGNIPNTYCE
jgi:hypothetical protein